MSGRRADFVPAPALAIALAVLAFPATSHATWSTDPAVDNLVAQDHVQLISGAAHVACTDGAGGFYVGWSSVTAAGTFAVVQHVLEDGTIAPGWPANGLRASTYSSVQGQVDIAPDGAGGVLVAWQDNRTGNFDIFGQRIDGAGNRLWGDGVYLSLLGNDDQYPRITDDGAGGMFAVWQYAYASNDHDVYAMHILPGGVRDPAWTSPSQPISASGYEEEYPVIASDSAGGFWLAWEDNRNGTDFDVYAGRYTATGLAAPGWVENGSDVTPAAASDQFAPTLTSIPGGGCYVTWTDNRSGNQDIYMTRMDPGTSGGSALGGDAPVVTNTALQVPSSACSDGAGGLYVTWMDYRYNGPNPYLIHLRADGSRYPGWSVDGLEAGYDTGFDPYVAPDGSGGVYLAFDDQATGYSDERVDHFNADGSIATGWNGNGVLFCTAVDNQLYPQVVPDGSGGAVITWWDHRSGVGLDHYAQRIDRYGALADARPAITSVRDVKADQGGRVQLTWSASYLDAYPGAAIGSYWIWRQAPASLAQTAVRAGAAWAGPADDPAALAEGGRRVFAPARGTQAAATGWAWEFLAAPPANQSASYSYVASTLVDSTAGHNPYTVFLVEAHAASSGAFWACAPDSGYSVDDLAPATPSPFAGTYASGTTSMTWGANHEADLAGYRLYRGSDTGFVPGPGNLVTALSDTAFADAAGAPYVYKLTAVDLHGNESPVATLVPQGTTASDGTPPAALELSLGGDNPSRSGAVLRFALPHAGPLRLAIFDAQGRRVRTLAAGPFAAGRYTRRWDGTDESGARVAGGLYFASLEADGRALRRKLVILR